MKESSVNIFIINFKKWQISSAKHRDCLNKRYKVLILSLDSPYFEKWVGTLERGIRRKTKHLARHDGKLL